MPKVERAINTELRFVPMASAFSSSRIVAFSFVRTAKMPMIDNTIPTAAISIGATTALYCISTSPDATNAAAPNAEVARMDPHYHSYKSAPMPATSPTLPPTVSAMVAGLRGSSSGMPASTLPTRSAPTSAAFV